MPQPGLLTLPDKVSRPTSNTLARKLAYCLRIAAILVLLIVTLAPIYWMLATSFKTELEATMLKPTLWPAQPTLENYRGLTGASLPFHRFFINTAVSCLGAAVVAVVIAIPAAYALSRAKFKLRSSFAYTVLLIRMFPVVVLLAPMYLLLLHAGLLDTVAGLVIGFSTFGLPFAIWMLKSFIDAIPIEIEEAARVDGYSPWQILFQVVVPLIVPGILTTGTFVFIESWNSLIYPLTIMTTLENQTLPAALVLTFTGQFKTDWGGMMAAATVTTIPLVIAFFAVQRSMVRGLTAGAVAGA